jgi:hypothetical protein
MAFRHIAAIIVTATILGGHALAADASRNDKYGLEVTFPKGWIVATVEEPILFVGRSLDAETRANCVVGVDSVAGTKDATQAQLNLILEKPFQVEFWTGVYKSEKNVQVESVSARKHKSGIVIQEAVVALDGTTADPADRIRVGQTIFIRPGLTFSVACAARAAKFATLKPAFASTVNSIRFTPPGGLEASSTDAPLVPVKSDPAIVEPDLAALSAGFAAKAAHAVLAVK